MTRDGVASVRFMSALLYPNVQEAKLDSKHDVICKFRLETASGSKITIKCLFPLPIRP